MSEDLERPAGAVDSGIPPQAFILAGAFRVICRNPRYVTGLAERGLAVLVMTPEETRHQVQEALQSGDPVFDQVTEVRFVTGNMDRESSFNADAIAVGADWARRFTVVGAFAMEESLVEPTGLIGDRLCLPSPGVRASRVCRSKYLQRYYLDRFSPWSRTVPPEARTAVDVDGLTYPVVAKPAGRHASSGVVSCESAVELREALNSYPKHETVLVEQRVVGDEYSVESLVQGGKTVFSSVTAKQTSESSSRGFVELSHTVPGGSTVIGGRNVDEILRDADAEILELLGYENGITHSEWRVTDTGEPYLMEVASRTPGDGITLLYELAFRAPLELQILRIALGEEAAYPVQARVARQVYLEHKPGVLVDVALEWPGVEPVWLRSSDRWPSMRPGVLGDAPALRAVLVLKEKGELLLPIKSSEDRAVTFLIDADTLVELDEIERCVRDALRISVRDDGGRTHVY
jgi:hypothetical protein